MGILEELMGIIDKPGRAVRGVLGGRANEGFAFLPFSDTIGLTDESNKVSGTDLLHQAGVDSGDGLGGMLAGMGVEMATDPLSYAGGALVKSLLRPATKVTRPRNLAGALADDPVGAELGMLKFADEVPDPRKATPQVDEVASATDDVPPVRIADDPAATAIAETPSLLESLGHTRDYGWLGINEYGRYDPAFTGISSDAVQEGLKETALGVQTGQWQKFIDENLGRLSEGGIATLHDHTPWQDILERRVDELMGIEALLPHMPSHLGGMAETIAKQMNAMSPYRSGLGVRDVDPIYRFAADLGGGYIDPQKSELAYALRGLEHLPLDLESVRKAAAASQRSAVGHEIEGALASLDLDGGRLARTFDEIADEDWNPGYFAEQISQIIDHRNMPGHINPQIAEEFLRNPPPEMAGTIRNLREFLVRHAVAERTGVDIPAGWSHADT